MSQQTRFQFLNSNGMRLPTHELPKFLTRLILVQKSTRYGQYEASDLENLSRNLREVQKRIPDLVGRIHERTEVSVNVISNIISERTNPKVYNFVGVLNAAIEIIEELLESTRQDFSSSEDFFQDTWPAKWGRLDIENMDQTINELILNTDHLVRNIKGSNTSTGEGIFLSDVQKVTLVAALETLLALLNGSAVEEGFLRKLRSWLADAAKASTKKQIDVGVGVASERVANGIMELLRKIFD